MTWRHVCIAVALKARCVLAEVRWRWTLKVLYAAACVERNLWADPGHLKTLHLVFSSLGWLMRILGSIVAPSTAFMTLCESPLTVGGRGSAFGFTGRLPVPQTPARHVCLDHFVRLTIGQASSTRWQGKGMT